MRFAVYALCFWATLSGYLGDGGPFSLFGAGIIAGIALADLIDVVIR